MPVQEIRPSFHSSIKLHKARPVGTLPQAGGPDTQKWLLLLMQGRDLLSPSSSLSTQISGMSPCSLISYVLPTGPGFFWSHTPLSLFGGSSRGPQLLIYP